MKVKRLVLGMVRTNCYIVYKEDTKKAVIIDPADAFRRLIEVIAELGVTPEAVLLTHGHFDHMLAADALRKEYHIPVCTMAEEAELLADPAQNASAIFAEPYGITADKLLQDRQQLSFLDNAFTVLATPGHTAGSCCYYAAAEKLLFSGDTLFQSSIGRTDLPTARPASIFSSIKEKLFVLPEDTRVLSGHGEETTIEEEKKYNPYVK